ncbi:hypothetical protein C2S51_017963 [Perilla frutescens var. frutescens]|nr:hypothetical protein C2S51_017963 [Perilla frutescens var. frutescens]
MLRKETYLHLPHPDYVVLGGGRGARCHQGREQQRQAAGDKIEDFDDRILKQQQEEEERKRQRREKKKDKKKGAEEEKARQREVEQMRKQLEDTWRAHQLAEEECRRDKARRALMWEQLYRRLDDRDGPP